MALRGALCAFRVPSMVHRAVNNWLHLTSGPKPCATAALTIPVCFLRIDLGELQAAGRDIAHIVTDVQHT